MKLTEIIEEFKKFDKSIRTFYPGIGIEKIEELERNIKHKLPKDFKEFLLISNGLDVRGGEIYGIRENKKFEKTTWIEWVI